MKRIIIALSAAFLVILLGGAALYLLSRNETPSQEPLNPQPPVIAPKGEPALQPQAMVEKQPLVILDTQQKEAVMTVTQGNEIVSDLKEKIAVQEAFVEGNGIRLPLGIVGTAIFRGREWDMRVTVNIERKEVMNIHIERHREKLQLQEFQKSGTIADFVRKAEQDPVVARRLEGKKYITNIIPPTAEGIVGVGFIDRQTKKPLFIADINTENGQVSIREIPSQPIKAIQEGRKAQSQGIKAWQGAALLLLATLVGSLVYMFYSLKKEN